MTFAATADAIGEVTDFLRTRISTQAMTNVDIGRPEVAALGDAGPKLNLFLFQVEFDAHLKNVSLDEGQPPPLWLALKYLLTAFDTGKDSDSVDAHKLLGQGLAVLHSLNFARPQVAALLSNPEPLKITFDAADAELLSKLMQGSDEKYRVSAAFQVRPVMIVPDSLPDYAPPVLTVGPPEQPGVFVMAGLGPQLSELVPARFEAGDTIAVRGADVTGAIDQVWIGASAFPVIAATEGEVRARVPLDTALSPGNYPVSVSLMLPIGRPLRSDAVLGTLAPTVTGATLGALTPDSGKLFGDVTITGRRLGGPNDSIFVAFWRDGAVVRLIEAAGAAAQTSVVAHVAIEQALPPGDYRLILKANGAQAAQTPEVHWA
jgi:hypothetical protein